MVLSDQMSLLLLTFSVQPHSYSKPTLELSAAADLILSEASKSLSNTYRCDPSFLVNDRQLSVLLLLLFKG